MKIDDFDFELPEHLIAKKQIIPRDSSRMLVYEDGVIKDNKFLDILDYISENDVIIFNDSKVIKAKLNAKNGAQNVEMNLHKMLSSCKEWLVFAKKTKKINIGDVLQIGNDFSCIVKDKNGGELKIFFEQDNVFELLEKYGKIPIPPYFKRDVDEDDDNNYQTIYAKNEGSVAAPTAGLHFTNEILDKLKSKNVKIAFITLHVGAGTFMPVKVDNITDHKMHSELCQISKETAELINKVKKNGGKVFAVGTTSLRTLEAVAEKFGTVREFLGSTDIFIYPGFQFKVVDKLITNFHLPKSTLLMLISAFSGMNSVRKIYDHAIKNEYRFYSYGDCCLLSRE